MGLKIQNNFFYTHLKDPSGFPSAPNVETLFVPFQSDSYRFRVDFG